MRRWRFVKCEASVCLFLGQDLSFLVCNNTNWSNKPVTPTRNSHDVLMILRVLTKRLPTGRDVLKDVRLRNTTIVPKGVHQLLLLNYPAAVFYEQCEHVENLWR